MRRNQEARRDERRSKEARVGRGENTTLLVHHTAHRQNFVYLDHPSSFYPVLCLYLRLFLSFTSTSPRLTCHELNSGHLDRSAAVRLRSTPLIHRRPSRYANDDGLATTCLTEATRVPAPPPSSSLGDSRVKRACRCTICPPLLCPAMTTRRSLGYL